MAGGYSYDGLRCEERSCYSREWVPLLGYYMQQLLYSIYGSMDSGFGPSLFLYRIDHLVRLD